MNFPIGIGPYDAKYPLDKENFSGDPYEKEFYRSPINTPDILHGGHRNPYQLENALKSGGTVFLLLSLGLNSLPGSCAL